ncbi:hypothetical protein FGB62_80g06 [Gracilaria domingensis]|nr:hypothetical protein FGB62_80g06 [Gracilaria domingensis]
MNGIGSEDQGALAACTAHPPSNETTPAQSPSFSGLASRTVPEVCDLSPVDVNRIILQAPENVRPLVRPDISSGVLIAALLHLRDLQTTSNTPIENARTHLRELLALSFEQVSGLAPRNPLKLRQDMEKALQADPKLSPRAISSKPNKALPGIVLNWKLQGMHAVAIPSEAKGNASESPTPQAANNTWFARIDDAPPPPPPTDPAECAEALEDPLGITIQPSKKAKISQSVVKPKWFTFGSQNREHATLKSYPGLSPASRTLAVNQLLGGHILSSMISAGDKVPQHVAKSFQKWHCNGKGPAIHAEAEAITLARIIHLTIVMHESPLEALQNHQV